MSNLKHLSEAELEAEISSINKSIQYHLRKVEGANVRLKFAKQYLEDKQTEGRKLFRVPVIGFESSTVTRDLYICASNEAEARRYAMMYENVEDVGPDRMCSPDGFEVTGIDGEITVSDGL